MCVVASVYTQVHSRARAQRTHALTRLRAIPRRLKCNLLVFFFLYCLRRKSFCSYHMCILVRKEHPHVFLFKVAVLHRARHIIIIIMLMIIMPIAFYTIFLFNFIIMFVCCIQAVRRRGGGASLFSGYIYNKSVTSIKYIFILFKWNCALANLFICVCVCVI